MFIQVIRGSVADPDELQAMLDRWVNDLAPGAEGWLGTTSGMTDDGMFVGMARFTSEPAARRNSERPEQHQWWMDTVHLFGSDVAFFDCRYAVPVLRGGSDCAGFVQVMQGHTSETERLVELERGSADVLRECRPDIIGGLVALHGDGGFTKSIYFTSEADARAAERRGPPPELREAIDELMSLIDRPAFFDLTEPLLWSPG